MLIWQKKQIKLFCFFFLTFSLFQCNQVAENPFRARVEKDLLLNRLERDLVEERFESDSMFVMLFEKDLVIKSHPMDSVSDMWLLFLPNQVSFKQSFKFTKKILRRDTNLGQFFHTVFADSIPTTDWEQLLHLGANEATVIVAANQEGKVNSVVIDVNSDREINTLQLQYTQGYWTMARYIGKETRN